MTAPPPEHAPNRAGPLRVTLVGAESEDQIDGDQLRLLADRLPRQQFDVDCFILPNNRRGVSPSTLWRLLRHVRRRRPAIVHVWEDNQGKSRWVRGVAALADARQFVVSVNGAQRFTVVDRWLLRRAAQVVTPSEATRAAWIDRGLPAEKLRVIPPGVMPPPPSPISRQQLLDELQLPASARLIGAIGPLTLEQRLKEVLWAGDQLSVIRDDVHLLVIGTGPQLELLERYRHLYHLDGKVHFLGRSMDRRRIWSHLDMACCAALSAETNYLLLEAQAAGVPLIAADSPTHRELIEHEKSGLIVASDHRSAIPGAVERLLGDQELRLRLGVAGHQKAQENFNIEEMVANYAALYRRLIESGSST